MISLIKIFVLFFLLIGLNTEQVPNKSVLVIDFSDNLIAHQIQLNHPGVSLTDSVTKTLFEIKSEKGHSSEFFMNVETVVCGDSQCRIDTIRIFWNALGFYDRLELPDGVALEKAQGEHFDQADYNKLNSILASKECSLKSVYKEEVVGTESTEGMDGSSGATIILRTDDYVKGAVWTCYTLWHWVNGDVVSKIRNIAGNHFRTNELIEYLKKDSTDYSIFALEQILRQQLYQPEVVSAIQKNVASNHYQLTSLTIQYFENATPEIYFDTMTEFLKGKNQKQRLRYLDSILKNEDHPPVEFLTTLAEFLSDWNDYPSINLFIKIIEKNNITFPTIIKSICAILNQPNFISARRAYWFLKNQQLSIHQEKSCHDFYLKNKDKL